MAYTNSEIRFAGTVSDDVTTAGANKVITMQDDSANPVTVGNLAIKCVTALTLKLNGESNIHSFEAGDTFTFDGLPIQTVTVIESGANIIYSGGYVS